MEYLLISTEIADQSAINRRIVGLDAWRAGLLLGGPVVHAAGFAKRLYPEHMPVWTLIEWMSHLFRMQAFFFISGLVSSFAAGQRSHWFRLRLVQLGLPLVTVWITLLIPIEAFAGRSAIATTHFKDPLHLWFLYVLIVATLAFRILRQHTSVYRFIDSRSLLSFLMLWTVCSLLISYYSAALYGLIGNEGLVLLALAATPYYVLFYLAGTILANCPNILAQVERTRLWPLGILGWVVAIALFPHLSSSYFTRLGKPMAQCVSETIVTITSILMCICVAHTALRVRKIPSLIWRFSRASFTVYLLHFPIIEVLCLLPGVARINPGLWFVLIAYTSLTLSLVAHRQFSRFAFFRTFYNGKIEGRFKAALYPQPNH